MAVGMAGRVAALAVVTLSFAASLCAAQVPIPRSPHGFVYSGDANAEAVLELWGDWTCPDTKAAWPALKALAAEYKAKPFSLQVQQFPLPYHPQAFRVAQAALTVEKTKGVEAMFAFVEQVLLNQDAFSPYTTTNITEIEIVQMLLPYAKAAGVADADFLAGMGLKTQNNLDVRTNWKMGCTRGVSGTPTFFVNGVVVQASPSWSVADWKSVIDPLLKPATAAPAMLSFAADDGQCPPGEPKCVYLPGKFECCKKGEGCVPNVGCRC